MPRPKIPLPARPDPSELPPKVADDPKVDAAREEYEALLADDETSFEHHRKLALAGRKYWSLAANQLQQAGEHDAARKAASTANEFAAEAHKLERDSVVDRVAAIEAALQQSRQDATRLSKLK